ncbi:esterase-like activity of phytase family protein [Sphingomonas montana]|uniref:esterase-like activity of phytase family protein n=1 Tax=Sphingomonas montana TaxID=1843236 RepID=UPI00096F8D06|nr:esterase-like activity of phytase family protein [Sphingomonas montana]
MRPGPFLLLPLALFARTATSRVIYDPAGPIVATAIPLNRDRPGPLRIGALRFVQGWRLRSPNMAFGGLSTMVADDAGRFTALSDAGTVFRFRMGPAGIVGPSAINPLPGAGARKSLSDTESMAVDPATGQVWVGYEVRNGVRRFDPGLTRITAGLAPAAMADWSLVTGPEAMERLPDGRFVILSENSPAPGTDRAKQALLFSGDPTDPRSRVTRFAYRAPVQGYWPTDIRRLPDGRLLVLHRRLSVRDGFGAMLAVFDPRAIRAGVTITSREVARLRQPLAIDNMEALAITREQGRTMIWIASDDNFWLFQQTLLLKFALDA